MVKEFDQKAKKPVSSSSGSTQKSDLQRTLQACLGLGSASARGSSSVLGGIVPVHGALRESALEAVPCRQHPFMVICEEGDSKKVRLGRVGVGSAGKNALVSMEPSLQRGSASYLGTPEVFFQIGNWKQR